MASHLLEDIFEVKDIDPEHGKKFDKVSRLICQAENTLNPVELQLDINTDIWPVDVKDKLSVLITTSLVAEEGSEETLLDKYEYAMTGRVFRFLEEERRHSVYASFGGLLMKVKASPQTISAFNLDQIVYILIRRVL
ncbi:hypothetical protein GEMRC1_009104 [Eukaryota sp. GEM-RC1]